MSPTKDQTTAQCGEKKLGHSLMMMINNECNLILFQSMPIHLKHIIHPIVSPYVWQEEFQNHRSHLNQVR